MLTAGLFLGEFVGEGIPWAHIDIAGPSFNEKGAHGATPKGGTGYGVATLLALVEGRASGDVRAMPGSRRGAHRAMSRVHSRIRAG